MREIILNRTLRLHPDHGLYLNTIWPVVEEPKRPNGHAKWWIVTELGREVGIKENEAKEV